MTEAVRNQTETVVIESWPYSCDSIAISPESGSYAIWCGSVQGNNGFAVIEWGRTIWISEQPPNEYLIEPSERVESTWAWSADGKHIAFFDENASESNLTIVDKDANLIVVLPYSAYWLSESYIETYSDNTYLIQPIKWSENEQYLLVYTIGGEENPCPLYETEFAEDVRFVEQACWQVIAADTGELVWPTQDKPYEAFLDLPKMVKTAHIDDAVITPDGAFIAIEYRYDSQNNLLVMDLQQICT
jgi:hypothetical protein